MSDKAVCPADHAHGANGTCYVSHSCGCGDCRLGRAEYEYWRKRIRAAGRELLVDAIGTQRRLRALGAIGWSGRLIAERYGFSQSLISHMYTVRRVQTATAHRIAAIYDDLWATPPVARSPHEQSAITKAKRWALENGWPPPLAWDDDTIDDPNAVPAEDWEPIIGITVGFLARLDEALVEAAIRGEHPRLSPRERRETVKRLHTRQWSRTRIAKWIGCSPRTVERIGADLELSGYDQAEIAAA
ncbi:helix-turn-helix domain-containing protein [Microbacterium lacus]|uniref:helix-turn-helix domain-containing protein n=1 Tax=Microbacterium lacus TaxID=415217 RepID=UPI000C2BFBC3|nr:helix-turn-helix domain-containing protein [Microbacterium lacus]